MVEGGRLRGRGAPGAGPGRESPVTVSGRTFDGRQPGGSREPLEVRSLRTRTATPRAPVVPLE